MLKPNFTKLPKDKDEPKPFSTIIGPYFGEYGSMIKQNKLKTPKKGIKKGIPESAISYINSPEIFNDNDVKQDNLTVVSEENDSDFIPSSSTSDYDSEDSTQQRLF